MIRFFYLSQLFVLGLTVHAQHVSVKTISVEPYMAFQNYEHFKRLVLNTSEPEAEYIEGFEFEWGYTYSLEVSVTKLASQLSDGTQYTYALSKVISKTKAADTAEFNLYIDPNRYYYAEENEEMNNTLSPLNDSTYLYMDEVEIEVPLEFNALFAKLLESESGKLCRFVFVNEKRIRLVGL